MRTLMLLAILGGAAPAQPALSEVEGAAEKQPTVTLHEKDTEVRDLLKSMQKQCGIRNMVIDRDVAGKGTVYFKQVPCSTAFRVVFGMFGLAGQPDPALMFVETRKR